MLAICGLVAPEFVRVPGEIFQNVSVLEAHDVMVGCSCLRTAFDSGLFLVWTLLGPRACHKRFGKLWKCRRWYFLLLLPEITPRTPLQQALFFIFRRLFQFQVTPTKWHFGRRYSKGSELSLSWLGSVCVLSIYCYIRGSGEQLEIHPEVSHGTLG